MPAEKLIDGMWNNLDFLEFPFSIVSRDRNFFMEYDAFTALRNGNFSMNIDLIIGVNHDEGIVPNFSMKFDRFIYLEKFFSII